MRGPPRARPAAAGQAAEQGAAHDHRAEVVERRRPQRVEQHPQRLEERLGSEVVRAGRRGAPSASSRSSSNASPGAVATAHHYHPGPCPTTPARSRTWSTPTPSASTPATWPGWPSCSATAASRPRRAWCSRVPTQVRGLYDERHPPLRRRHAAHPARHHQRGDRGGRRRRHRAPRARTTRCSSRPTSCRSSRSSPAATTTPSTAWTAQWCFDTREMFVDLTGDLSHHLLFELPDDRDSQGKVALVSGAASGIGAAVVDRLVDEGATVVGVRHHADRRRRRVRRARRGRLPRGGRRDAANATAGSTCWPTSPASPRATGSRT